MAKTFIELDSNDIECDGKIVVERWASTEADFKRFAEELQEVAEPDDVIMALGRTEPQSIFDFLNFQSQMCGKIIWDRITDR